MNKEELIGKLQMVYVGDKNALNELIGYYDGLKQGIDELQQENKQLKEEYENIINRYKFIRNRINQGMSIENKNKCLIELGNNILQELDKGSDNNE